MLKDIKKNIKAYIIYIPVIFWISGILIINMYLFKYNIYDFGIIKPQSILVGAVYWILMIVFLYYCMLYNDFENFNNNRIGKIIVTNCAKAIGVSLLIIAYLDRDLLTNGSNNVISRIIYIFGLSIAIFSIMIGSEVYENYKRNIPYVIAKCIVLRIEKDNIEYSQIIKKYYEEKEDAYYKKEKEFNQEIFNILYKYIPIKTLISRSTINKVIIIVYIVIMAIYCILIYQFDKTRINILEFFLYTSFYNSTYIAWYSTAKKNRTIEKREIAKGSFGHIITSNSRYMHFILLIIIALSQQVYCIYSYANSIYPIIPYSFGGGLLPKKEYVLSNEKIKNSVIYENEEYVYLNKGDGIRIIRKENINEINSSH